MGRRGAGWRGHRTGVKQAELVSGGYSRPHDPAAGAANDGKACRRDGRRSGSHAIYVSQPEAVAEIIEQAAPRKK